MKKLIPILLAFLPLAVSCKLDDTYTQTNINAYSKTNTSTCR